MYIKSLNEVQEGDLHIQLQMVGGIKSEWLSLSIAGTYMSPVRAQPVLSISILRVLLTHNPSLLYPEYQSLYTQDT